MCFLDKLFLNGNYEGSPEKGTRKVLQDQMLALFDTTVLEEMTVKESEEVIEAIMSRELDPFLNIPDWRPPPRRW